MDWRDASLMYHAGLVLLLLWAAGVFGWSHSVNYFIAFFYLLMVNERYTVRLRRRLQHEERKSAYQRRLLHDSESVRWLNYAVQKMWPICMERLVSQQFLSPIVPWFLDKFKPWTVEKAAVQKLYLGRNPPLFTEIRVLTESTDDDHLVLEIGMNFLTAEDMGAVLAVQLSKSVGLGITANMHLTSMHVEGKVLVGVKFLRQWPFLGRIRLCFIDPPYFQMTVKPLISHGLDVTELPGISGWLDHLLDTAFEQTLVQPNMLVLDVEKFVSSPKEGWFSIDEKPPVAHVNLEIIEGADFKPSDLNGLADPYVKGHLGSYRFTTKIQWKTLNPKWTEEFRIPITSWDAPNDLFLQVLDKDPMFDDHLGDCTININELRGGQRHDKWLALKNIKKGRIHLGLTVTEHEDYDITNDKEICIKDDGTVALASNAFKDDSSFDQISIEKKRVMDEFEPIKIEGQEKTGVWVHRPGTGVLQTWEPRKGRAYTVAYQEIENSSSNQKADDSKSQHSNGHSKLFGMFRKNSKSHRDGDHKPPPSPGSSSRLQLEDKEASLRPVPGGDQDQPATTSSSSAKADSGAENPAKYIISPKTA